MSEMFSRRSFLKLSGALVAASALAACSGGSGGGSTGGNGGSSGGGSDISSDTADFGDLKVQALSSGGYSGTQLYVTLAFTNKTDADISFNLPDFSNIQLNNKQLTSVARLKEVRSQSSSGSITVKPNTTSNVNVYFENTTSIDTSVIYNITFTFNHGGKKAVWTGSYKAFRGVNCTNFALQS